MPLPTAIVGEMTMRAIFDEDPADDDCPSLDPSLCTNLNDSDDDVCPPAFDADGPAASPSPPGSDGGFVFDGDGDMDDMESLCFTSPAASENGFVFLDERTSRELAAIASTHASVRLLLEHNDRLEAQLRGTKVAMRGAMRHALAAAVQARARAWLAARRLAGARRRVVAAQSRARRRAAVSRLARARSAAVAISACWRRRAVVAHTAVGRCLCGKRRLRSDLAAAVLLLESPRRLGLQAAKGLSQAATAALQDLYSWANNPRERGPPRRRRPRWVRHGRVEGPSIDKPVAFGGALPRWC
ncbi:hypothetical protein M885DRAFT_151805 [Pelagophyceae sp. CCMP2097]|nr:hypothetical protein M885DRAFT_151805 [Pelagophyceae sp. CCMP2097]